MDGEGEEAMTAVAPLPLAEGIRLEMPDDEQRGSKSPLAEVQPLNLQGGEGLPPLLTKRELWLGWYGYDFANSVYATVAVSLFLPLLITTLAEAHAREQTGASPPPVCSDTLTVDCGTCIPGEGDVVISSDGEVSQTVMRLTLPTGMKLDPTAYASFCISMSVLAQVFFFISFGPVGDYGGWRKQLLRVTSAIGALLTASCAFLWDPSLYWVAGLLLVASNTVYGMSIVYYNSYLPLLVDATSEVRDAKQLGIREYSRVREATENTYSQYGMLGGYLSGSFLLIICLGLYLALGLPEDRSYALMLGLTGLWWLVLGAVAVENFCERPGQPMPKRNLLVHSWASILSSLREIRKYKQAFMFLLFYFFFSDAYSTVASVGILFAQRDLCMAPEEAVYVAVIIPSSAALGNFGFLRLQRAFSIPSKTMLLINLYFFLVISLWGCLGFLNTTFGLRQTWEIFLFGVVYGLNLGSVQSYSRTIFTDFIPPGAEARFFSLFEITDRGSSWLGPIIVSIIVQYTGKVRLGLLYLAVAMLIPTVLVHVFTDHARGVEESGRNTLCREDKAEEG